MEIGFDVHIIRNVAQKLKILKARARKAQRYDDMITITDIEKMLNGGLKK